MQYLDNSNSGNTQLHHEMLLIRTIIALLQTATVILPFNMLFTVAIFYLYQNSVLAVFAASLLVLSVVYLHIRIAFDISLFKQFVEGEKAQLIDKALLDLGLLPKLTERSMISRCKGALTLWKRLLLTTVLQCVFIVTNVI